MTEKLENAVEQLKNHTFSCSLVNENVSKGSVGWHIEHSLLVIDSVAVAMLKSEASEYQKPAFSFARFVILLFGKIPRGKGRAPKAVTPKDEITAESLTQHLTDVGKSIDQIATLTPDKYFKHPLFGNLKFDKAVRFLEIHTLHHLKIVEDILKP